jgi:RND superfamily putative drug exporter
VPYYGVTILLSGERDIRTDPAAHRAIGYMGKLVERQRGFQQLLDYSASQLPALIARDGRETVMLGAFATPADSAAAVSGVRLALQRSPVRAALAGMKVRFGGSDVTFEELARRTGSELARAELFALPILLLLTFWFFRGLVAALLPLLVGGLSILLSFLVLRLVHQFTPISVFALNLVTGVGLGLGIDYSLFVLSRYREELAGGADVRGAIARTLQTAGRTVLYSSVTVAVALATLLVFPIRFLSSMGIGGVVVALSDGAVALLVLPALLIVLGPRVNALSPVWLQRRAARSARPSEDSAWWKLARGVMRHPVLVASLAATIMLAAAVPALHLRLIDAGANLLPPSAENRKVEAALTKDFAANPVETIDIVVKGPFATAQRLAKAAAAAAGPQVPEVRFLGVPYLSLGHGTWEIDLLPHGDPFSSAHQQLVRRLRALARPYGGLVGGWTAYFIDQKASIASRAPIALLILVLVVAGAVFLMTGSLVLPVKAVVMNLLTVSTGAGLLVLTFQEGHLSSLLGFTPIGGLEEGSLVLMFVVVFALSTDYEVFVLGRIKEARDSGLGNREAVALGMERTGRLITAAAVLFCVAIGALGTTEIFLTKQFGLGAALAVALDASIVRALLVPSFMALLGERNWWAPRPLRRLHDRIGLGEGDSATTPADT